MTQMTIQQAIELAMRQHQAGQFQQAEAIYRQVLAAQPKQPDALHMLGLLALQANRADIALQLIDQAIEVAPSQAGYHCNRGQVLATLNRNDEAMQSYRRALSIQPDMPEALNNLGNLLRDNKQLADAIECFRKAAAVRPDVPALWLNLARSLHQDRQVESAIGAYQNVLKIDPDNVDVLINLGIAWRQLGQFQVAAETYSKVVKENPALVEGHKNLGEVLLRLCQHEQAIEHFTRALELRPNYAPAYRGLGNAFRQTGKLDEAIDAHRRALSIDPDYVEGHNDLGYALHWSGRWEESQAEYRRAIDLEPGYAPAHYNLGLSLLLQSNLSEGWREYDWRWRAEEFALHVPQVPQPLWDGGDLQGKRLLLYAEQGFGDAIQFARYLPLVAQRGIRIILKCPDELIRLFQQLGCVDQLVGPKDQVDHFDAYLPLMSLPHIFQTTMENIPANVPYLYADIELSSQWRDRLANLPGGKKIGLTWAGRNTPDPRRSIAPELLLPLSQVKDIAWIRLQRADAGPSPDQPRLLDYSTELQDFAETAALIDNLDLVITIDTAVAHLAGAMGKTTWLLLPHLPDWRWLLDRDDSPWYPTMRLFRQPEPGNWALPIQKVVEELKKPWAR